MNKDMEELKRHIDTRLDRADYQRGEMAERLARVETKLDEKVIAGEKEHAAIKETCEARSVSLKKRVGRLEGGFIAIGLGAVAFAWEWAKSAATGKPISPGGG